MPAETTDAFGAGNEAQPVVPASELAWQCGGHGSCVEIASLPDGRVAVRDGKLADASAVLTFTRDEWDRFTAAIRTGELG
ncbi:MAG TPA: DUF397 domain-containing protein [Streptosporangiaceae bacterium]|nr:DUF397 domain-containing protein [Streptosporangiaceae bacterium]